MSDQHEVSRRDLLQQISVSISLVAAGANVLSAQDAQHVHQAVQAKPGAKGLYKPKALSAHEYATLDRLTDLIIPADEHSPGAKAANSAAFIDYLCSLSDELKEIYTGGLGWLDGYSRTHHQKEFLSLDEAGQRAVLDVIAYKKNASPELNPGIAFFTWARNMTVDAYYTSPIGVKDVGFMGNGAMSEFSVPKEAVEYALKRSPLA